MNSLEKRHFIRATVEFPFVYELRCDESAKREAQAVNISVDGIMFRTEEDLLAIGAIILVHLPEEWTGACAVAMVVRREGSIFGCQFIDLPPTVREALDRIIYRHWRLAVHNALPSLSS